MLYKLIALSQLSIFLISVGLYMVLSRRKAIEIVIGLEIITNGIALNLVLMSLDDPFYTGTIISLFLIIISTINIALLLTFFIMLTRINKCTSLQSIDKQKSK